MGGLIRCSAILCLLGLGGCVNERVVREGEREADQKRPGYSLVQIEMLIRENLEDTGAGRYDYGLAAERFAYAGPSVVPEFERALDDPNPGSKKLAGYGLESLTSSGQWPEAYRFVIRRLKRLPLTGEARWLLFAIAHGGVEKYPEIAPFASAYLDDQNMVFLYIAQPGDIREEVRVCDLACYVLQCTLAVDFGASAQRRVEPAVEKARAYVKAHPGIVPARQTSGRP